MVSSPLERVSGKTKGCFWGTGRLGWHVWQDGVAPVMSEHFLDFGSVDPPGVVNPSTLLCLYLYPFRSLMGSTLFSIQNLSSVR